MTVLLRTDHLYRAFGSLVVTRRQPRRRAGERHALIGPNGAGKTSLVHQIGGQLQPTSGRILFDGRRHHRPARPTRSAGSGCAHLPAEQPVPRTCRCARTCGSRCRPAAAGRYHASADATPTGAAATRRRDLLAQVRLGATAATAWSAKLSYGEQRQLEIAIALAGEPELLLLDEPTSGMSPAETDAHDRPDARACRASSAILMIEHDMKVVFSLADRDHRAVLRRGARHRHAGGDPGQAARARGLSRDGRTDARARQRPRLLRRQPRAARRLAVAWQGRGGLPARRNGAGKTTTILTIMGYLAPRPGRSVYDGATSAAAAPSRWRRLGFGFVPQERGIFPSLTVRENLTVARARRRAAAGRSTRSSSCSRGCGSARRNLGFQLSGGEQQMLSIARALMLNPTPAAARRAVGGTRAADRRGDRRRSCSRLKGEGLAVPAGRAEPARRARPRRPALRACPRARSASPAPAPSSRATR